MTLQINSVAVIGAGTMGAAIAAHVANAGYPVLLLDIIPNKLTAEEEAKGLTLDSPAVRNRIVQGGFERMKKARPASLMSQEAEKLITLGNTEDDFAKLGQVDWIVEVIIEKLKPKQEMMARLEAICKPGAIITSNTSGLPINSLVEGRGLEFKHNFLGSHFFNPVRYMKLLEIIPTPDSDPDVVQKIAHFGEEILGKGPVFCKDTPNFIGNRLFSINNCFAANYGLEHGYSVSEIDELTGPVIGRPRTGTYRLQDLVGVDIAAHVAQNLYALIPHDPYREILAAPKLTQAISKLMQHNWLGNKSGQGYYKQGKDDKGQRVFMTLNLTTFEYEIAGKVEFESLKAVAKIEDLGQRVKALLAQSDRAAQFVRDLLSYELSYISSCAPEIAHDLKSIDEAMRWGFAFEVGLFQLWDMLGVTEMVAQIEANGRYVAGWVKEMLAVGCPTFYRTEHGLVTGYYNWHTRAYQELPHKPKHLKISDVAGQLVAQNESATLYHMNDGVLLLEFHTKANAIDSKIVALMHQASQLLRDKAEYVGLVIGNEGEHFSTGANILEFVTAAQAGQFEGMEAMVKSFQDALMAFRYSRKPVVVALHGMALGGGAEVVLAASRVVAHGESYLGLVEVGVGVIPAGCGTTALIRRFIAEGMAIEHNDPLPFAQRVFETIGMAKVSTSAAEGQELGFLEANDRIILNRDNLLYEAKQEVLSMVAAGYTPPSHTPLYAGGRDLLAALKLGLWTMQQSGYISAHDALIGGELAHIIAGGNLSAPQWVDESYFLQLECEAFIALLKTAKTQERIWHMLKTRKPLRN